MGSRKIFVRCKFQFILKSIRKGEQLKKVSRSVWDFFYLQAAESLVLHFIDFISFLPKFPISFFFLGAEIKSQINTFRYFLKDLAKTRCQKSRSGRDDIYESKWTYFKSLSFLHDSLKSTKTIPTLASKTKNMFTSHLGLVIVLKKSIPENCQKQPYKV